MLEAISSMSGIGYGLRAVKTPCTLLLHDDLQIDKFAKLQKIGDGRADLTPRDKDRRVAI